MSECRPVVPRYLAEHEGVGADEREEAPGGLRQPLARLQIVELSMGMLTASVGKAMGGGEVEGLLRHHGRI